MEICFKDRPPVKQLVTDYLVEQDLWLMEGMLHADVVGFHAFDHARHFL